ncbi:MAG: hypothetical protein ACLQVW_22065 [Limisphaerales bacterium]
MKALSPVDAVSVCLNGDFGMSDEAALISAIRKDQRITLSDDELMDLIVEAMEDGVEAPACLERLAGGAGG